MKVDRSVVKVSRYDEEDEHDMPFEGTPSSGFEMVWEITSDILALQGKEHAESRLQRDVVTLIEK